MKPKGQPNDRVGNPLTRQRNGSTSGPWSYTAADQRTDWTYDAAGNVLNDGTATYTYDALGRLTKRTQGGTTSTYTYNGDGLLVASTTNGATTRFLWDTTTPNAQLVGTQQASGTTWYVWSPMGGGTARVLYSLGPSGRRWLISDGIGSVRRTLSDSGTVIQARQWTPFGVEIGGTASAGLGYAGEWQEASGLVYLRARWYDPAASRFLSRDPWDGMITNPQTLNPYAYAHNQPTRFTDPSGRCIGILLAVCAGGVIGGGINLVYQIFDDRPGIDGQELLLATARGALYGVPYLGQLLTAADFGSALGIFLQKPTPVNALNLTSNSIGLLCSVRVTGSEAGGGSLGSSGGSAIFTSSLPQFAMGLAAKPSAITAAMTAGSYQTANIFFASDGESGFDSSIQSDGPKQFTPSDEADMMQFASDVEELQRNRAIPQRSGGQKTWEFYTKIAIDDSAFARNFFVYRQSGQIRGAMHISNGNNHLKIGTLEATGGGAGTELVKEAVRESQRRNFGGRILLDSSDQAMGFYEKLGFQLQPNHYLDENAALDLLSR